MYSYTCVIVGCKKNAIGGERGRKPKQILLWMRLVLRVLHTKQHIYTPSRHTEKPQRWTINRQSLPEPTLVMRHTHIICPFRTTAAHVFRNALRRACIETKTNYFRRHHARYTTQDTRHFFHFVPRSIAVNRGRK